MLVVCDEDRGRGVVHQPVGDAHARCGRKPEAPRIDALDRLPFDHHGPLCVAAGADLEVKVPDGTVVLDLGDGQFAYYAHLKPSSVRVKAGDRVRRGDPLAEIGNSGDARWPHLHFQVTLGPHILASEGVPFLIDGFRAKGPDGTRAQRANEYPIGDIQVDFPGPGLSN